MSLLAPAPAARATDDYAEFCVFLRELCGIDLSQYKRSRRSIWPRLYWERSIPQSSQYKRGQMERRLRSFYLQRGISDLTDSFARLRSDPEHLDELLDRVTINVSQLWRNPEQWELIQSELLPDLARQGQIRAWSAGCSYGAEAYTLAALCYISCPSTPVRIRGTDIDRRMIARAKRGVFTHADARSAPAAQLERGFEALPEGWRARPRLRAMTSFEVGDLLRIQPRPASYDLVLCRNTVIYFSEPIRDELHARLAAAIRPGGYLVIGSTERVCSASAIGLTCTHPFIYRKT